MPEVTMTPDRAQALEDLLAQAAAAHSVYERTELDGVYDDDWPRWYAAYAVQHEIGDLLDRVFTVDELARFFVKTWEEAQRHDPPPTEPWPAWMARRLTGEA